MVVNGQLNTTLGKSSRQKVFEVFHQQPSHIFQVSNIISKLYRMGIILLIAIDIEKYSMYNIRKIKEVFNCCFIYMMTYF